MKNTILILMVFAIVIKAIFALGVDESTTHGPLLIMISNLLIISFSFVGLFCQWMWDRTQTQCN